MENRPGFGGALAHGACCGLPLLFFLFLKFPLLLLYGGGVIVFGGLLGGSVLGLRHGWKRRERYQTLVRIRQERMHALHRDGSRTPGEGLPDALSAPAPPSGRGAGANSIGALR